MKQSVEPNAEETWQHIKKTYCRNSCHLIIEAPGYPDYLHKEAVVIEVPR